MSDFKGEVGLDGVYHDAGRDPAKAEVTLDERRKENREQLFPVLTAEEEAAKAKREGREPRIVRCRLCRRSVWADRACAWCFLRGDGPPPQRRS